MRRREFLATTLVAPALVRLGAGPAEGTQVASPNGAIAFDLAYGPQLTFSVTFRGRPVIEPSPLSMLVDGVDLAQEIAAGNVAVYHGNDHFPTRGVHAEQLVVSSVV